ncbi:MAG: signal peptidase I [bacterium]
MKRMAWLAALLTVCLPGLGHHYCGRTRRGIVAWVLVVVIANACFAALLFVDAAPLNVILPLVLGLAAGVAVVVDSVKTAKAVDTSFRSTKYHRWYVYIVIIAAWIILGPRLVPMFGTYESFKVPSTAMENTVLAGDYFLADMSAYRSAAPQRNDVVVFIYPVDGVTKYVKRCVALPGDTVEVRDKVVLVNGNRFEDPAQVKYIDTTADGGPVIQPRRAGKQDSRDNFGPFVVPRDCYFMMGDNRDNSYDSRYWGAVHRDLILGKAVRITWSQTFDRVGMSVK